MAISPALPYEIWVMIACHLPLEAVEQLARTSRWLRFVCRDEFLWKTLLLRDYKLPDVHQDAVRPFTYRSKYMQLYSQAPAVCHQTLTGHSDEVLHAAFSADARKILTCSKDGTFCLWTFDHDSLRAVRCYTYYVRKLSWNYAQFCQFCPDNNNLVLVSGTKQSRLSADGELAVFDVVNMDSPLRVCSMHPYDVFGCWASERHVLTSVFKTVPVGNRFEHHNNVYMVDVLRPDEPELLILRFLSLSMNTLRIVKVVRCGDRCILAALTGDETYTPHCVGLKVLDASRLCAAAAAEREAAVGQLDQFDRVVRLSGQIVGLCVSPDQRYLFANYRPWQRSTVDDYDRRLQDRVCTQIIAVDRMAIADTNRPLMDYCGHRGFTDADGCFFIGLDVSDHFVASGSEDSNGLVWCRRLGCCVALLAHTCVVNHVAFHPLNEQILLTSSDDHTNKIWISRSLSNRLLAFNSLLH